MKEKEKTIEKPKRKYQKRLILTGNFDDTMKSFFTSKKKK